MTFSKTYKAFTLSQFNDKVSITEVTAEGSTFGEMLTNTMIYAEDWHGNLVDIDLNALRDVDAAIIRADIAHYWKALHAPPTELLANGGEEIKDFPEFNND